MKKYKIQTYEEAVRVIEEVGILPLSPLVPNHPSLESITPKEHWYTGSDLDPWLWRAKFPGDGTAAYGKFIKKKSILISRELFPWVKAIIGSTRTLAERYEDGTVSKTAMELFSHIKEDEGIETRALRAKSGMKAKEMKKTFDQALLDLQSSMDIVISGVKEKRNLLGEKNGWNSTSFETVQFWMNNAGVEETSVNVQEAKRKLQSRLADSSSSEAMVFFQKLFQL